MEFRPLEHCNPNECPAVQPDGDVFTVFNHAALEAICLDVEGLQEKIDQINTLGCSVVDHCARAKLFMDTFAELGGHEAIEKRDEQ